MIPVLSRNSGQVLKQLPFKKLGIKGKILLARDQVSLAGEQPNREKSSFLHKLSINGG